MQEGDFEIFLWKGQKRYRCNQKWEFGDACTWNTHDMELLMEHISKPHTRDGKPMKKAPQTVVSPIVDERGEQIVRELTQEEAAEYKDFRFKP